MTSSADNFKAFIKELNSAGIATEVLAVDATGLDTDDGWTAWEAKLSDVLKEIGHTVEQSALFDFCLGQQVKITCSGETGQVIGRAQYATTDDDSYYIRYKAADGRATEAWWQGSALEPVGE